MGIAFDAPLALLLLVPALVLTFALYLGARRRTGTGRRRVALVVRTLLLTALVFALAGFRLVLPVDRLATVFVVDLSDSVGEGGREDALAFVRDSLELMPEGDVAGIVAFGKGALVERLPAELRDIDRIASAPVTSATDVGSALRLASALFPDDAQKRIVLLSDGNDTTGQGQAEAALAAARGVQVETKTIGLGATEEVLIERITAPSTSRLGDRIEVTAQIRSTTAQPATVRLFANGVQVEPGGVQRLDLQPGTNDITFLVEPEEAGFVRFRVVVEAALNTFSQNDRADANTIVQGEPRTLVVSGDEAVAAELIGALETERQNVDSIRAEGLSSDPLVLAEYDSIVLVDVPRTSLTDRQMLALQVFVRDLGKGLVMVGGPNAYGAGGYEKTAIEETLPVDMGVRSREKQPDIALVVVIDKSGSMDACHCNTFERDGAGGPGAGIAGVRKVDIGKEAILRAAAAMTSRDEIGVVAFDGQAHWVVRTQPLGGVGDLQGAVGGIQPLGNTNIFAGLKEAVDSLEGVQATRRHIILLTDGWSSSGAYDEILGRMDAAGITLSTVGAGGGSNPFLADLASRGGGRFYPAANPASIPDIFLKETQQVSGQQIVEETFHPIITSSSPILRGLDEGFPQLLGYNGTTAKAAAQTVLVTARDDPLLAQWQFGLGRAVAWTSDSTGRWAKAWVGWDGFAQFFSQLVGWTFPGEETGGIEASFITEGSNTKLRVESVAEDGSPRDFYATAVAITDPELNSRAVGLAQVAPGVYEAPLGEIDAGAYVVRVSQTRPGSTPLGRTLGLVAPTPAEYRLLGTNEAFLAALRSATGGRAIDLPAEPWTHDLETTDAYTDLWPTLLIIALLLWPLDIALRRVSVGRRELADARRWVAGGWRRRGRTAPRPAQVSGLLAARDRAAGSSARAAILRGDSAADGATAPQPDAPVNAPAASATTPAPPRPAVSPAPAPRPAAPAPLAPPAPAASSAGSAAASASAAPAGGPAESGDTLARLREAKRRARGS
ncbi:MAG TPA: VWA domain-containing protein [Candidatus Limnocylindrales bacterium]|nr:VWA domain-containing protein [Candidatus Limnocylindrales bacterium]